MSRTLGKTLGTATVRKLASKQPLGLEALLVTSVQHHINIPLDVYWGGVQYAVVPQKAELSSRELSKASRS